MMVQAKTHAALKMTLNFVSQPSIFKSAFFLKAKFATNHCKLILKYDIIDLRLQLNFGQNYAKKLMKGKYVLLVKTLFMTKALHI